MYFFIFQMSTDRADSQWLPDLFQRLAGIASHTDSSTNDQKSKEDANNNNKTLQVCSCHQGSTVSYIHRCDLDQSDDSGLDLGSGSGRGSPDSFSTLSTGTTLQGEGQKCQSETQSTHSLESECNRISTQNKVENRDSDEENTNSCREDYMMKGDNSVASWMNNNGSDHAKSVEEDSVSEEDHHGTVTDESDDDSTDDEKEVSRQSSREEDAVDNERDEDVADEVESENECEEEREDSRDSDVETNTGKEHNCSDDNDGSRNNTDSESDSESDATHHQSDKEKSDEEDVDTMPGIPRVPGLVTQESTSTVTEYEGEGWVTEDDDDNNMNIPATLTGDIGQDYLSGPLNTPGRFTYNHYTSYSTCNYNKSWDSDSESEDEYEYLKAFYLPTGRGYALPRREPKSIKEAVRFWERDFEVRSAIYRKMSSWEELGLVPNPSQDRDGYAMYAKIRDLNHKWNQCGRSQQLWYRKYAGYTLNEIARLPLNGRVAKTRANPRVSLDTPGHVHTGHSYSMSSKTSLHLANTEGPNGTVNQKVDPFRARRKLRTSPDEGAVVVYPGPCMDSGDEEEHVITYPQREISDYGYCHYDNVMTYPPSKSTADLDECDESPISGISTDVGSPATVISQTRGVHCITNDNEGKLDDIFNFIDSVIGEDDTSSWRKSTKKMTVPDDSKTSVEDRVSLPDLCDTVNSDENPQPQRRNRRLRRRNAVIDSQDLNESDGEPDLEAFWSTDSECSPSHGFHRGME